MNTSNKVIAWNPLREIDEAQNRLSRFFLGGFPNRMGSGEIPSLAVADWSPEVDISEDDHGYLLKADLPEMKKDDVKVTVEDGVWNPFWIKKRASRWQLQVVAPKIRLRA